MNLGMTLTACCGINITAKAIVHFFSIASLATLSEGVQGGRRSGLAHPLDLIEGEAKRTSETEKGFPCVLPTHSTEEKN